MKKKITTTLSRSVCGGWDRSFLESILDQILKGRSLSLKQKESLGQVLARNTPDDQKKHQEWESSYLEEYKQDAIVLAAYHARQPYYRPMAADIIVGNIPERSKFLRMHANKYSKKVLIEQGKAPRYAREAYVMARANFNSYKNVEFVEPGSWEMQNLAIKKFMKHGGFIVGIEKHITTYAKGAKRYRILPAGGTTLLIIEERFIKQVKRAT
jgi:hypothetical protein